MSASSAANLPQGPKIHGQEEQKPVQEKVVYRNADEVKNELEPLPSKTTTKLGLAAVILSMAQRVRHFVFDLVTTGNQKDLAAKLKDGSGASGIDIQSGRKMQRAGASISGKTEKSQGPMLASHRAAISQSQGGKSRVSSALSPKPPSTPSPRAADKASGGQPSAVVSPKPPLTPSPRAVAKASGGQPSPAVSPKPPSTPSPRAAAKASGGQPSPFVSPKPPLTPSPRVAAREVQAEPASAPASKEIRPQAPTARRAQSLTGFKRQDMEAMRKELSPDLARVAARQQENTANIQMIKRHSIGAMPTDDSHSSKVISEMLTTEHKFVQDINNLYLKFYSQLAEDKSLTPSERLYVNNLVDLCVRTDRTFTLFNNGLQHLSLIENPDERKAAIIDYYDKNIENLQKIHSEGIELKFLYDADQSLRDKIAKNFSKISASAGFEPSLSITDMSPVKFMQRALKYDSLFESLLKDKKLSDSVKLKTQNLRQKNQPLAEQINSKYKDYDKRVVAMKNEDFKEIFNRLKNLANDPLASSEQLKKGYQEFRMLKLSFAAKQRSDQERLELLKSLTNEKAVFSDAHSTRLKQIGMQLEDQTIPQEDRQKLEYEKRLLESLQKQAAHASNLKEVNQKLQDKNLPSGFKNHLQSEKRRLESMQNPSELSAEDRTLVTEEMKKLEKEIKEGFPVKESDIQQVYKNIVAGTVWMRNTEPERKAA